MIGSASADHIFVIEAGQFGEISCFRHHEFGDTGKRGLADFGPPVFEQEFQQVKAAAAMSGCNRLVFSDDRDNPLLNDRLEQRILVLVVEIQRSF